MTTKRLDGSPSALPLIVRASLGALPGAGRLPFLAGGGGEIPDLELELPDLAIDSGHVAEYCRVCGFTVRESVPATYPHVLAFPTHLRLLTDPSFPLPAIGMVHIANRIEQRRPIGIGESLSFSIRATQLEPHPKGKAFKLLTEVRVGSEVVWTGEATNLRRGGGSEGAVPGSDPERSDPERSDPVRDEAEWSLPGDLGRRYAGVSADHNPIHLYGVTAKAFGFPRQIAHGMWTKARSLAQLESRLPDAFAVEVAFKKPILLPSKVVFSSAERDGGIEFGVRAKRDDSPHLTGSIS